ncbi:unnamed protein product [Meloidogyne enterolobii]|uniref:Uncharacterized protein n=1 Tax=Meloidogyne enterolobii TaxID=390850 RepID=A0ACB1AJT4_MELEN
MGLVSELKLRRNDHFATSPQLTFSIPNAKPIPLLETENGLQKYYKIDYNGINPTNLNQKSFSPSKTLLFPIPVAALIVQPNSLSGCNCLKGNSVKPQIIEEDVPEENCESRCEKCTGGINEESGGDDGNNNCCDECQNILLEKSKKEEGNKGEQQQQQQLIFHQEPENNKIPLEASLIINLDIPGFVRMIHLKHLKRLGLG